MQQIGKIFCRKITDSLLENGVEPATQKAEAEEWIKGGSFISYRNDSDEHGRYLSQSDALEIVESKAINAYNLSGTPGPFEIIELEETPIPELNGI